MQSTDKVAVLMGGISAEREISLLSGNAVLKALRSKGIEAHAFDVGKQDLTEMKRQNFTRAFIMLHGKLGEDGCIQGALECMQIPYTGPGVAASAVAMNKKLTKLVWRNAGLPLAADVCLTAESYRSEQLAEIAERLGYPLIVKPNTEGSSVGLHLVTNLVQFQAAVADVLSMDSTVICEQFISGREMACSVLGSGDTVRALPLIEIVKPQGQSYDYQNKYFTDIITYRQPQLADEVQRQIQTFCEQAYKELGCRGWGRLDLIYDAGQNKVCLLEINTAPGMTEHSLFPKAAAAAGIGFADLCVQILEAATLEINVK